MYRIQGRGEVYTGFWWGYLRERDHLEDLRLRWEDNNKMGSSGSGILGHGLDRSG